MTIAQRIGDTETTLNNNNWTKTLDRWKVYENTEAVLTATRTHGTYPTTELIYLALFTKIKSNNCRYKYIIKSTMYVGQYIEGFNWRDLRWEHQQQKVSPYLLVYLQQDHQQEMLLEHIVCNVPT